MRHGGLIPTKAEKARDRTVSVAVANIKRLETENALLLRALLAAVQVLGTWHGPEAFDIYCESAPEMKPIREALAATKR